MNDMKDSRAEIAKTSALEFERVCFSNSLIDLMMCSLCHFLFIYFGILDD